MRPIDADSLVRLIQTRLKWHGTYTIEEVIRDIKDAPTLNTLEYKKCTKDARKKH